MLICFFYLNYYFLIPKFYFKKKYSVYALLTIVCFFITMFLPGLLFNVSARPQQLPPPMERNVTDRSKPPPPRPPNGFGPGIFPGENILFANFRQHIFLFLAAFFFSLLLRIRERWLQAEKEKLRAELSYLRAQVNPHFLFNTLNSIYSLAINKSDDTATAVVKLSEMMRYVLHDAVHHSVSLQKELNYIRDFIALQELRFGKNVPVSFEVTGDPEGLQIAPLLLITFVENAFKYGVNAEEDMLIKVSVDIREAVLRLNVFNKKVKVQHRESSGFGIGNAKNRLELLYPKKYNLSIMETSRNFTVSLTMNLQ